jgi:hypothetical protein
MHLQIYIKIRQYLSCLFLALCLMVNINLRAQEAYDITFEDASNQFGGLMNPSGLGLFYRHLSPAKKQKSQLWELAFSGIHDFREKKIMNQKLYGTTPYVYGKVNRLYALRPLYGINQTLSEKTNKNSVGINVFAAMGPCLGFLKPNYVVIEVPDPINMRYVSESVKYNPELHKYEDVVGYAPFRYGLNETKPLIGLSFKAGVNFNWGYYSQEFKSIELGCMIDYLPSQPEILHGVANKSVFSAFYVSFAFGNSY